VLLEAVESEFLKTNSFRLRVKKFRSNISSASFFNFSSLPALTSFYQKGEGYSEGYKKKKGSGFCPKPLIYLVAGTGFEPVTFGL
jgi:hypothetical protein